MSGVNFAPGGEKTPSDNGLIARPDQQHINQAWLDEIHRSRFACRVEPSEQSDKSTDERF